MLELLVGCSFDVDLVSDMEERDCVIDVEELNLLDLSSDVHFSADEGVDCGDEMPVEVDYIEVELSHECVESSSYQLLHLNS